MSSASKVASRVMCSGSAPKLSRDSTTSFSICSSVTAVLMRLLTLSLGWGCGAGLWCGACKWGQRTSRVRGLRAETPVDIEGAAGDVAGLLGGEKAHARSDLLGASGSPGGNGVQN